MATPDVHLWLSTNTAPRGPMCWYSSVFAFVAGFNAWAVAAALPQRVRIVGVMVQLTAVRPDVTTLVRIAVAAGAQCPGVALGIEADFEPATWAGCCTPAQPTSTIACALDVVAAANAALAALRPLPPLYTVFTGDYEDCGAYVDRLSDVAQMSANVVAAMSGGVAAAAAHGTPTGITTVGLAGPTSYTGAALAQAPAAPQPGVVILGLPEIYDLNKGCPVGDTPTTRLANIFPPDSFPACARVAGVPPGGACHGGGCVTAGVMESLLAPDVPGRTATWPLLSLQNAATGAACLGSVLEGRKCVVTNTDFGNWRLDDFVAFLRGYASAIASAAAAGTPARSVVTLALYETAFLPVVWWTAVGVSQPWPCACCSSPVPAPAPATASMSWSACV